MSHFPPISFLVLCQPAKISSHLQNSLHTICRGWQAPVLSSSSPGGSQSRKACGSPMKQLIGKLTRLMVPSSLTMGSHRRWLWHQSGPLWPRWRDTHRVREWTPGQIVLVSVSSSTSPVIMGESLNTSKHPHIENVYVSPYRAYGEELMR